MTKLVFATILLVTLLYSTVLTIQRSSSISMTDKRIAALAAMSACAKHQWKKQGRAPIGYIKGMAVAYARAYCESKSSAGTAVSVMKQPPSGSRRDALVVYGRGGSTDVDRLRSLYTLGIGLGMKESTGNTTEGPDAAANNLTAITAHAGLFQASYDSLKASPLLAALYNQYRSNTDACRLDLYREGVVDKKRPVVGAGPGAEYQRFTKACPAFATEYALLMLRINCKQFGPMVKREVEYVQACDDLLRQVETEAVCTP
jgi:hypothetical protein